MCVCIVLFGLRIGTSVYNYWIQYRSSSFHEGRGRPSVISVTIFLKDDPKQYYSESSGWVEKCDPQPHTRHKQQFSDHIRALGELKVTPPVNMQPTFGHLDIHEGEKLYKMASGKLCGTEITSYVRLGGRAGGGGVAESAPTYVHSNAISIHRCVIVFKNKQISLENTQ
jgi:hypothetical protein